MSKKGRPGGAHGLCPLGGEVAHTPALPPAGRAHQVPPRSYD